MNKIAIGVSGAVIALVIAYFIFSLSSSGKHIQFQSQLAASSTASSTPPVKPIPQVAHMPTPAAVKAVYMTACIADTPNLREKMLKTLEGSEINALMIDIKDYTGTLAYASTSVEGPKGNGCRIRSLPELVASLHAKGLYMIARVTVFQDPLYSKAHPELAVQSRSHPGRPWADKKGLAFIDPNSSSYWDYIVSIAKEAHAIGFDEVNFDYIRFPSDGNMSDAHFAIPASTTRAMVITKFFKYLRTALLPEKVVMSADIFGQTTINTDDMGIGQILENALPYFDYVAPMVYPSHFIDGFAGYANPAAHPYEIIKYTMGKAVQRALAASSSPEKLRPWLQAFDLGATYTPALVHAQMQATYDVGLTGWMLWDASNRYSREEL
ncbi:MAG: hypothetical protein JWO00_427 [Candidatus Parcubacteria bacterium]|nr:hypothetical protein [Candidatus Parcubacteria bacterium]